MKFYIYTLGCKVNTYESSVMSDILKNNGYIESNSDTNNDICVINTCTVTNTADNKSYKIIRHAIRNNPKAIIIVVGCASQVNKEEILKIDGVDIVIGNKNKTKIVDYIKEYQGKLVDKVESMENAEFENMQLNNFNKTRAFVKIQDGCNNFCSYCIIPYTRGNIRSKKKEDVLNEITNLIKNDHHEIVLTGIHTGSYGSEFNNYSFTDLLKDILKIDGLERLRISSIEITELNDEFLNILRENKILVDHMHIPLQSGSNKILVSMNRKYDKEYFINKINKIRKIRPNISITTDVIVGFPGETNENFEEMIDTIKKIEFTKLHVFPYSKRKGTVAANMYNQISDNIKKERSKILLDLSKKLELNYMNKFLNKEVTFIPEVHKDNYLIGHTGNYLLIKCNGNEDLLNKNVQVIIKKIDYPYCIGTVV